MKIVILVVGICVILLILFLSYFADTRKSTKVSKKEKDVEKSDFEEELEDENYVEDLYSEANEEDIPYEKEENESYETDKVLASDIDETEEYSDEGDDESLFSSISKDEGIVSTFGEDDENDIVAKDIDKTKEELESTYTAEIADTTSTTFNTEEIKGIKYEDDTSVDSLVENNYEDSDGSYTNNNSDDVFVDDDSVEKTPVDEELLIDGEEGEEVDLTEEVEAEEDDSSDTSSDFTGFSGFTTDDVEVTPKEEEKEKETTETVELGTFGGDINNDFLAAMEENLVASKNKRLGIEEEPEPEAKKAPAKKTTTKKTTTKKEAEKKEPAKKEAAKKETTAKKTTTTKKTTKK